MAVDNVLSLNSIQTLFSLPESSQADFFDSTVSPYIKQLSEAVQAEPDATNLAQWLAIQSSTIDLAVEGISEVTFGLAEGFPDEFQAAVDLLTPEQKANIDLLTNEFQGQEQLSQSDIDSDNQRVAALADELASMHDRPRAETGVLAEFVGTGTFTSSRGCPVVHGALSLFSRDGALIDSYAVNSGGGAKNYRMRNGPLPPGIYGVSNFRPNRTLRGMVLHNVGFSFNLNPIDDTRYFGRSLFRIHPDGDPLGTNGCLGVRESAAKLKECRQHLADLMQLTGTFKVSVRY